MIFRSKTIFSDEPAAGWMPWPFLTPVLAFAFVIVAAIIGQIVLEGADLVLEDGSPAGTYPLVMFLLLPFSLMAALTLLWTTKVEKRSLASIGLTSDRAVPTFLQGHLIGLGTITLVVFGIWIVGGYLVNDFVVTFSDAGAILGTLALLVGFGLQGSVEEVIFRGWLLSSMTRKSNLLVAIIVSSALFGLLHFDPNAHWLAHVNFTLFGLFAAAWVVKTGNIWGAMGWHAGWNWLLGTGFDVPVTGLDTGVPALLVSLQPVGDILTTGGDTGPEGSYICTLFFAVATSYLFATANRQEEAVTEG